MKAIVRADVALTNYQVRRRRYGGRVWLILHNEWFEIDGLFDYVWRCAQAARCFEYVAMAASRKFGWSLSEAVAGVSAAWVTLLKHGLVKIGHGSASVVQDARE
ncbi:hypothetical protein X757_03185 [Mesorhizobium sp. LSHC414A00]|nr:hypothetical protein X757_03185 [Mesorhizobium sp. LSHC414A00]